jgi:hypothetical protein
MHRRMRMAVLATVVAGALVASGPTALADKKHRDKKAPGTPAAAALPQANSTAP